MTINIENLVRSGVALAVGLPIALSLNGLVNTTTDLAQRATEERPLSVEEELRTDLTRDCLIYAFTEVDSKLERTAKDNIDTVFGGQVDYGEVCAWVLR